jgi:hypothetical protein
MPPSPVRRLLCVLAALAGLLAGVLAASASASIVIGQSIGGVKLGATPAQVKRALGPPLSDSTSTDLLYPTHVGLRLTLKRGHVTGMLAISKQQKTNKGIGIGSSRAALKAAYPSASCLEGPYGPSSLYCAVTARFHGRKSYTSFLSATPTSGVTEIELGYGVGLAQELHQS